MAPSARRDRPVHSCPRKPLSALKIMKKPAQALLGLALLGTLFAAPFSSCRSSSESSKSPKPSPKCECGTEDHDVLGCPAECGTGQTECENPLCTCEHVGEAPGADHDSTTTRPSSK